jgi:hypothetical protein
MHLCIPVILAQNHIAARGITRYFPEENPKMRRIFSGTVVFSAADSNRSIASGNRSSTKNPFPTVVVRQTVICKNTRADDAVRMFRISIQVFVQPPRFRCPFVPQGVQSARGSFTCWFQTLPGTCPARQTTSSTNRTRFGGLFPMLKIDEPEIGSGYTNSAETVCNTIAD